MIKSSFSHQVIDQVWDQVELQLQTDVERLYV